MIFEVAGLPLRQGSRVEDRVVPGTSIFEVDDEITVTPLASSFLIELECIDCAKI
jgi:hypothetical protein